jgi:hypothetical protein
MKVHEILREGQANEGVAKALGAGLSRIPGVGKVLGTTARVLFGKGLVKQARIKLAYSLQHGNVIATDAAEIEKLLLKRVPGMTQAKAARLAADARFIKSAEKLGAKTARGAEIAADAKSIQEGLSKLTSVLGTLTNLGIQGYMVAQLVEIWTPVYEHSMQMQQQVAAGSMPIEEYAAAKKVDVDRATEKTIVWVASIGLAKLPLGVVSKILGEFYKFKPGSKVGALLSSLKAGVNTAGTLALMNWINTQPGAVAIGGLFSGLLSIPLGMVSPYMLKAEEMLERFLSDTSIPAEPVIAQQASTAADQQAATDAAAAAEEEPAAPAAPAIDYSTWVYSSPGHIRNPATGEVHRSDTAY